VHAQGAGLGVSAERLMRARYSAYVRHDGKFLLASWHPDTRPESVVFDDGLEWLGLEIVDTEAGSAFDNEGIVEFKARFRRGGEHLELHERSSFIRIDGRWVYLDAT
jgi:SEC-C motif-containing protein